MPNRYEKYLTEDASTEPVVSGNRYAKYLVEEDEEPEAVTEEAPDELQSSAIRDAARDAVRNAQVLPGVGVTVGVVNELASKLPSAGDLIDSARIGTLQSVEGIKQSWMESARRSDLTGPIRLLPKPGEKYNPALTLEEKRRNIRERPETVSAADKRALQSDPEFVARDAAIEKSREKTRALDEESAALRQKNPSLIGRSALTAAASLPQSAAAIVIGLTTKNPALAAAAMAPGTYGSSYARFREEGLSESAARGAAVVDGAIESLTELLPADALLKPGNDAVKKLTGFLVRELPGESVATITQELNSTLQLQKDGIQFGDFVEGLKKGAEQLPETLISTLMGGSVQSGAVSAVEAGARKLAGPPATDESPLADSEAAQARAREAAAAAGADTLEQEIAAAQVQAEATARLAEEMNRQASVDKAMERIAELTAEMDQAEAPAGQDAIQQAEQRIQEELQGGEAARAAGFEQAGAAQAVERAAGFEQAEAAAAQQREVEVAAAEVQKQEQLAGQPLVEPAPQRPLDRATTSLSEAAPEVFRTLQERRAATVAPVPQPAPQTPSSVAPGPQPSTTPAAPPKTMAERRAREAAKRQQTTEAAQLPPQQETATERTARERTLEAELTEYEQGRRPTATTPDERRYEEYLKRESERRKRATPAAEPALDRTPKALRNKPKVQEAPKPTAQAQPVVEEQEPVIEEDETGEVRASNESVELLAQENQGFLQVKRVDAKPGAKGKGRGVALYERLAQQAEAKGLTLASDFSVSPDAVEVYRALERRGFEVTRNPATVNPETKNLVSADPRKPVFEVRPKKRGIGARNAAKAASSQRSQTFENVTERSQPTEQKAASKAAQPSVREQADAQYKQDLPSRGGLTSMPIERTRAATKADKATFDQEMLARAKAGEIELIPHDDVKRLTPEQRANAIQDPENKNRVYSHWRPTKPDVSLREGQAAPQGWGTAEPGEVPAGLSLQEAKQKLSEFFREYGNDAAILVQSVADLPAKYRNYIESLGMQNAVRGFHDAETGEVYIIAGNHNENTADVLQTATHEFLAHKGLYAFLGEQRDTVLKQVYKTAKDRAWIEKYARDHGWDLRNPVYQVKVADEYIAYLSENLDFDTSVLQRFFDAMRAILRKLGLVQKYTSNDLRRLIRMSRANARSVARANREIKPNLFGPDLQFATDFRTPTEDRNPLGSINGMGLTMEDQANYSPGFVTSRWNALKDFGQNNIQGLLSLIPRRNLVDFLAAGKLPAMRKYLSIAERMDGRRNELMAQTETLANRWVKYTRKQKKNARILAELMNASTLAGVDPLESYRSSLEGKKRPTAEQRTREAERKAAYDALKKYADRLDPEGQQIYRDVRDSYAADRVKIMAGIEERINAAAANDEVKRTLLNEIRKKFESGKVAGPYFPLARFGKHWAVAKDAAGDVMSFIRSDSPSQIKAWREQMKAAGMKTDGGEQMTNASDLVRQVDPNFAAKVADMAQQFDQELADQIWQMYLQSLPETSLRKQFTHRQGRLGFTADALRAFGHIKFHAAHQIAKLEFMHRMESELQQMQVEARTLEENSDPEAKWVSPLVKEMDKRHQWARNPENSSWANNLTALGFAYYLGVTPAAALVNLAQTPMVAFPTIAAEYGWMKTGKELLRSSAQWASSWGPLANRLRGEERAAFDEALRVGLFSQTRTADLAGIGQQGEDIGSARQTFMKIISWAFQQTEQANREITFLAAYRLAKDAGLSQEAAIEQGRKLTDDSHFQYQNTNRPRVMQGDAKKVLFLFRQYSTNMTYRLARDFRNSTTLQELPAGERSKAIQRLSGLLMMTFLNAGLSGMPLLWLGYIIVGAMMGDEDEPYDAEAALRTWLEEWRGEEWASRIMDGTVANTADVTLSTRVGLGNLWLQDKPDNLSVGEEFGWWAGQALGPIGGMVQSGITAGKTDIETYGDRAVEQLAPKAARDVLQATRFAREGVTNKRGDVLVSKDELSSYDLFVKSLGFQPLQITQQYGKNRAIKEEEKTIQNRRITLMNRLFLAAQAGDQKMVQETVKSMQKFNRANPRSAIDAASLISSARSRARYSQEAINGITVQKDYRYLHEKYGNRRRPKETEE